MKRKPGELMVSKIPSHNQTKQIHPNGQKWGVALSNAVCKWVVTMSICLAIWAVLSPLFYEQFYATAGRWGTGDFKGWLFSVACFAFPLLLAVVSSTRKVIVTTREQYFPSTNTDNADLPIRQTLVRASSEPLQAQQAVLLRAAEGVDTQAEQLVRAVNGQE